MAQRGPLLPVSTLAHGPLVPHAPSESVPQWLTGREGSARRPGQCPLAHGPSVPGGSGRSPGPGTRACVEPHVLNGLVPLAHGPLVPHRPAGPPGSRPAVSSRGRTDPTNESGSIRVSDDACTVVPRGHRAIERASSESGPMDPSHARRDGSSGGRRGHRRDQRTFRVGRLPSSRAT